MLSIDQKIMLQWIVMTTAIYNKTAIIEMQNADDAREAVEVIKQMLRARSC